MSDLISRQAAIEALDEIETEVAEGFGFEYEKWRKYFCDLPPAQPELIRCKDCRHYNAGFECLIEGYGIERNNNWYCADAERRTDE